MGKIAAVIPAGGYSLRMGLFKPLLPLGDSLVIEKTVSTFLEAGIHDIYVVVGHRAHLLEPVIERLGVKWTHNIHYKQGMYSSIMAGVDVLPEDTDAFFLLPADTPSVTVDTIKELLSLYKQNPYDVIYPIYEGVKGHPPLISTKLSPAILQGEVEGGLKTLLSKVQNVGMAHTKDAGILHDLDTEEDYRNMLPPVLANYPTKKECEQILKDYNVPEPVILHTLQVAKLAGAMALYLNSRGFLLHLGLLQAACLLHDIAKGEPLHAEKGKELICTLGYPEVASIIGTHTDLPEVHVQLISEYSLLYLADKMIEGTAFVTPEQRKADKLDAFLGNPDAGQAASVRLDKAIYLQRQVEKRTGTSIVMIAGELNG